MLEIKTQVKVANDISPKNIDEQLSGVTEPLLLKGLVSDWPVIKETLQSKTAADQYLRRFYQNMPLVVFRGPKEIKGRFFYNDDLTGFNFVRSNATLDHVLDQIQDPKILESGASMYIGSTPVDQCLPSFRQENDLSFANINPLASIWLGNKTRIAAHYDLPDNIACVAAGKRRFTLFPPEQLKNLYVGPIDFTPAGQAISLVDFHDPDYDKFPKFEKAIQAAQLAELEAGDAIFIPSMWWHHVEALTDFNVLINYWWSTAPHYSGSPMEALYHAILCIRDLPHEKRMIWKNIFEFYIFYQNDENFAHINEEAQGALKQLDEQSSRKIRALLSNYLRR